jgi:ATP-dependent DNA helicase RecQ
VLRGEQAVELRRPSLHKKKTRKRMQAAADDPLLARLKAWRMEQARSQSVPPYVVFHDATLSAIAAAQPRDLGGLSTIPGIGARKLERYGPSLLELLNPPGIRDFPLKA